MADNVALRYQQLLKHVKDKNAVQLEKMWRALPDYREETMYAFIKDITPLVQGAQDYVIALTDAYMSARGGVPVAGLKTADLIANIRKGVPAEIVYQRPFVTMRASIRRDGVAKAIENGLARLLSTADMDVSMAARDATTAWGGSTDANVIGFTRVADPGCCDFCLMIDGATVYISDPAPLHNRCGCTLDPIISTRNDGQGLRDRIPQWETISAGSVIGDTKIQEHGELGPLITNKNDEFTSFNDLPKAYQAEAEKLQN